MRVKPLLKSIISSTFLEDYLSACGVEDVDSYLDEDADCLDNPMDYPNMKLACKVVWDEAKNGKKFGILADCDGDGYFSAAICYDFLKTHLNTTPIMFFHTAKQHGLTQSKEEDIVQQAIDAGVDVLIVPDAGTGDSVQSHILAEHGITMIVLDHHPIDPKDSKAIIVNHNLGSGLNTALSGTGVVYKFCRAFYQLYLGDWNKDIGAVKYLDLVAVSLISDVCDLRTNENHKYLEWGINLLEDNNDDTNPMLQLMVNKLNNESKPYILERYSFGVIPPINSLCRGNNQADKELFFKALVGEATPEEGLKVARAAHNLQTKTVKTMVDEIAPSLDNKHKAIVGFTDVTYQSFIGLAANKFMSKENKPTILLRELNSTTWTGSLRSPIPLNTEINKTKLAVCQGHEGACGITVKKSNLKRLVNWLDTLNLEVKPVIGVTAELKPKQITTRLCKQCVNNSLFYSCSGGSGVTIPQFYIRCTVDKNDVYIYKKKTTTIKIMKDGVSFLKFFATPDEVKSLQEHNKFTMEMIVKLNVNEWNGNIYPQGEIVDFEVSKIDDGVKDESKDESWEDDF